MKISDLTACVVDKGVFLHVAQRLAKDFKRVYYWTPWEEAFPVVSKGIIGDGYGENLIRVPNFWDVKNDSDLFVFTDTGFGGEQRELARQGMPIWGHRGADVLETHRGKFLTTLEELGMAVPEYEKITGLDALKDHLRDSEDKYIKISKYRGDWETFHWRSWEEDEAELDSHAHTLGPAKNLITFYVFEPIDTEIEDGTDSYRVNGRWPSRCIHGMERKDKAYLCAIQDFDKVHRDIREINERFGPVLDEYGMCGPFSTEARMTEEETLFIDPTIRYGSPPSQIQMDLIGNWGEIVWHGANGELVEPEEADDGHVIGAQILITGERDRENWATLKLPTVLRPHVKSSFACQIGNQVRIAPNLCANWLGWLTATGKTIEGVIETLKERKELLPSGVDCDITPIANLLAEAQEAEAKGVKMTNQQLPEPEAAMDL